MATLLVNDIYQVRIYCTHGVQTSVNVLHYQIKNVVGIPTDADLANVCDLVFSAPVKAIMAAGASYRGVGVQRRLPIPPSVEVFDIDGQGAGGVAGDPLPKQTAGMITKRTAFAGRAFRGRFYAPFPAKSSSDAVDGRPTAAYLTSLGLLATALDNTLAIGAGGNTAEGHPIIFNPQTGTAQGITLCVARPYWATQRRRGDFGQANRSPI